MLFLDDFGLSAALFEYIQQQCTQADPAGRAKWEAALDELVAINQILIQQAGAKTADLRWRYPRLIAKLVDAGAFQ